MHVWYIVQASKFRTMLRIYCMNSELEPAFPYVGPYWDRDEAQRVLDHWTK